MLLKSGDIDNDAVLDVGETWVYTATHTVTLPEFEVGKNICNVASVTVDEIKG